MVYCWLKNIVYPTNYAPCSISGIKSPISVTIGNTLCSITSMTSNQITCSVAPGTGTNIPLMVSVNGQSINSSYSYPPPIITSITQTNTAGGIATIQGYLFGASASDLTIIVNGQPCTGIFWYNASYISCVVAPGTGTGLPVNVTAGRQSTQINLFSYYPPTAISTTNSDTTGGLITITGSNFGTTSSSITAVVNGRICTSVTSITDSKFSCILAAGVGKNLGVYVTVNGQTSTTQYIFSYNPPSVISSTPTSTDGGLITITGSNFGPAGTQSLVTINSQTCSNAISQSSTSMTCSVYPGTGAKNIISVIVGGQSMINSALYSYLTPTVTLVTQGNTTGTTIRVTGSNFGTDFQKITAKINTQDCTFISVSNSAAFQCNVVAGIGASLPVNITVDGLSFYNPVGYSYYPPLVTSSTSIGTSAGKINITGVNFGSDPSFIAITVGTQPCITPTFIASNTLQCALTGGTGTASLVVTVGNQNSSPFLYSYQPPTITNVNIIPTIGGTMQITANNLGINATAISMSRCISQLTLVGNTISCSVGSGFGSSVAATLTVNGLSTPFTFSYMAPSITNVLQPPTDGTGQITVYGSNFASSSTIFVNGALCAMTTVASNLSMIRCNSIPGIGSVPITILVGDQQARSTLVYQPPAVTSANILPTTGGDHLCFLGHRTHENQDLY